MTVSISDAVSEADARKWSWLTRVPASLGAPFAVHLFGDTAAGGKRNRGVGRQAYPLTGTALSIGSGYARFQGSAGYYDLGAALTQQSFGIAMICRAPNLPTAEPGTSANHSGFFGNFATGPSRGIRGMYQTYNSGSGTVDIAFGVTVDNSGTPIAVNSIATSNPDPTGWKALAFTFRAGVGRAVYNFTDGKSDVDADTRARLVASTVLHLGATSETPETRQQLDICNLLVVDGTGWDATTAEAAVDFLRADAVSVGITA